MAYTISAFLGALTGFIAWVGFSTIVPNLVALVLGVVIGFAMFALLRD